MNRNAWLLAILDFTSVELGKHRPVWLSEGGGLEAGREYTTLKAAQSISTRFAGPRNNYVVSAYANVKVLRTGPIVLAQQESNLAPYPVQAPPDA